MNKEIDWDQMTEASLVELRVEKVTCKEMAIAITAVEADKAAEPSEICAEMTFGRVEVGISVTVKLCQHVLDGKKCCINGKQVFWYQFSKEKM